MSTKPQTVHVRINDAATGKPTPVRVRFTDAAGNYFPPFGRLAEFATERGLGVGGNVLIQGKPWAYIDGACEIDLPPGEVRIQVAKGPEFRPLDQEMTIQAGKLSLRLSIERLTDLRAEGWYAGDTRCHFLSPQAALLEGQGEDLAVVNVLITSQTILAGERNHHWLGNILEFSGQQPAALAPGHLVAVNSLNQSYLGLLGLLNCHRVVYPLKGDFPLNWALADWCGQCHRKGGLVLWCHFDDSPKDPEYVSEGLADLILGEVDALETTTLEWCRTGGAPWYHLLNCGFKVPLTAGSGKSSNATHLGRARTYAHLLPGEDLDYRKWIEAVRAGRTFVTNGPLLWFTVEGQGPGATVQIPREQDQVQVRARAQSLGPLERLELLAGGEVIADLKNPGGGNHLEIMLPLKESTWLAARCWGSAGDPEQPSGFLAAHTSPVYVQKTGQAFRPRPASLDYVLDWLSRFPAMLHGLDSRQGFKSSSDRDRLAKIFERALAVMQKKKVGQAF